MDRFVSRFTNKVDAKGRVSVPAPYRAVLAKENFDAVYCYRNLDLPAIDAGGGKLVSTIDGLLEKIPPFSDEYEQLATALYGESDQPKIDGDGRIVLSEALKEHAGITDQVVFVGLGFKFQIWEPARFEAHLAQGRERLRDLKALLGTARGEAPAPGGARE